MRVDKVQIALKHPQKEELFSISSNGTHQTYSLNCGIMGKVVTTGEFENITNGYTHPLFNGLIDIETSMPLLCIPIKDPTSDHILGALQVINSKGVQGLSALERANVNPLDMETLTFFSKNLGQAILNCYRAGKLQAQLKGETYGFEHELNIVRSRKESAVIFKQQEVKKEKCEEKKKNEDSSEDQRPNQQSNSVDENDGEDSDSNDELEQ